MQVIDGSDHVMGRLATYVAKQLLNGEEIAVVNAESIIITGRKEQVLADYRHRRELGVSGRNRKGPFYPRMPDRIFRRTVRGMLPYQQPRGRTAYRKLRVYIGVPRELKNAEAVKLDRALDRGATKKVYLGDVARWLGARF